MTSCTVATTHPQALACDLQEDLDTRWLPDPIADADLLEQLAAPRLASDDLSFLRVPRGSGGTRTVPLLSAAALAALHEAVHGLRQVSHEVLAPTVCGYRVGAEGAPHYSLEYRRFREMTVGMAEEARTVIFADVRDFFGSVNLGHLQPLLLNAYGDAVAPALEYLAAAQRLGLRGLPAGYADARLVANMILALAETDLPFPFVRWVDDYRLFVNDAGQAEAAVRALSSRLNVLGLELNASKLRVLDAERRRDLTGAELDSVYHPGDESPATTRANLRSVFFKGLSEGDRRTVRFALPRLAAEQDDVAVDYVLKALRPSSIDAPRMVSYLFAFLYRTEVSQGVQALASSTQDPWLLGRLAPLLARIKLPQATIEQLSNTLPALTAWPVAWGLMLRVLSLNNATDAVLQALSTTDGVPDPRAALAAHRDLERDAPPELIARAPQVTALALPAIPPPSPHSLL